jgi:hypothetical protein
LEPRKASEPVQEARIAKEPEEAMVNGSRTTEIQQESIKNTLKEIISEIEEAVVSEVISDSSAVTNKVTEEASWFLFYSIDQMTAAHNWQEKSSFKNMNNDVMIGSTIAFILMLCVPQT